VILYGYDGRGTVVEGVKHLFPVLSALSAQ